MKSTTLPLYLLFSSFMLSAILSIGSENNLLYYLFSLIGLSAIYFIILLIKSKTYFKFNTFDTFFLISIFSCFSLAVFLNYELMGIVLLLLYTSIVLYFKIIRLNIVQFLRVINITYLIYLLLSIISYSGIFFAQDPNTLNSFVNDYGFISFETLYGLEGSTAAIDSYSALIILLNIFLNKNIFKYLMITVSLFALLWTTRLTPIVILIFAATSYVIVRNKFLAVFALSSIFLGFFLFTFLEMFYPKESFFIENISNSTILQIATHGRTFIWSEQFKSISANFNAIDYLIGNYNYAEVFIPWGTGATSNSHNSFLYLFFRIGISAVVMIIFLMKKVFFNFDRRTFPIIFGVFLSATTNGAVFYVGNPVFFLVLIYLTYFYKEYNFIK